MVSKKLLFLICFVFVLSVGIAHSFQLNTVYNPFSGKLDYVITSNFTGENVTADYFIGNGSELTSISDTNINSISWNKINNYPTSCPSNTYITELEDSVTCTGITDYWLDDDGDTATGDYNFNGNITANYFIGNGSELTGIDTDVEDIWVNESGDTMNGDLTLNKSNLAFQDSCLYSGEYHAEFDGVDDYVEVNSVGNTLENSSNYSVSFWMKANALPFPDHDGLIGIGDNSPDRLIWVWGKNGGKNLEFYSDTSLNNEGDLRITGPDITEGTWYHVVLTWNGTDAKVYYDNNEVGSDTTSDNTLASDSGDIARIGNINGYGNFNGSIDEVMIYNRTLNSSEISELYNANRADSHSVSSEGLVGFWKFDNGTAEDSSGQENDGTFKNGAEAVAEDPTKLIGKALINYDYENLILSIFGAGTTSSSNKLKVLGDVVLTSGKKLGIGTTSPSKALEVVGNTKTTGALSTGSNTLSGLSDGDINVSEIFYDTLTAKSPIFKGVQHSDWKELEFPEYIEQNWKLGIKVNDTWNIEKVYFKYPDKNIDRFYTPSEFNNQVCDYNNITRDMCNQIINKTNRLHNKKVCLNQNYKWDGSCYEINKISKTYSEAVNKTPVYNTTTTETNYTCTKLDDQLHEYETTCTNTTEEETDEVIGYNYKFNEGCDWNEDMGYYCEERSEVVV